MSRQLEAVALDQVLGHALNDDGEEEPHVLRENKEKTSLRIHELISNNL